jgi:hypothetical protein
LKSARGEAAGEEGAMSDGREEREEREQRREWEKRGDPDDQVERERREDWERERQDS